MNALFILLCGMFKSVSMFPVVLKEICDAFQSSKYCCIVECQTMPKCQIMRFVHFNVSSASCWTERWVLPFGFCFTIDHTLTSMRTGFPFDPILTHAQDLLPPSTGSYIAERCFKKMSCNLILVPLKMFSKKAQSY